MCAWAARSGRLALTLICRCSSDVCNELRPRAWSCAKKTLNLDLNLDRCALLLPPGHASAPSCFSGMRVSTRGTKVAGAPIGDDEFCAKFVQLKVQEAPTNGYAAAACRCSTTSHRWLHPSLVAEHFAPFARR